MKYLWMLLFLILSAYRSVTLGNENLVDLEGNQTDERGVSVSTLDTLKCFCEEFGKKNAYEKHVFAKEIISFVNELDLIEMVKSSDLVRLINEISIQILVNEVKIMTVLCGYDRTARYHEVSEKELLDFLSNLVNKSIANTPRTIGYLSILATRLQSVDSKKLSFTGGKIDLFELARNFYQSMEQDFTKGVTDREVLAVALGSTVTALGVAGVTGFATYKGIRYLLAKRNKVGNVYEQDSKLEDKSKTDKQVIPNEEDDDPFGDSQQPKSGGWLGSLTMPDPSGCVEGMVAFVPSLDFFYRLAEIFSGLKTYLINLLSRQMTLGEVDRDIDNFLIDLIPNYLRDILIIDGNAPNFIRGGEVELRAIANLFEVEIHVQLSDIVQSNSDRRIIRPETGHATNGTLVLVRNGFLYRVQGQHNAIQNANNLFHAVLGQTADVGTINNDAANYIRNRVIAYARQQCHHLDINHQDNLVKILRMMLADYLNNVHRHYILEDYLLLLMSIISGQHGNYSEALLRNGIMVTLSSDQGMGSEAVRLYFRLSNSIPTEIGVMFGSSLNYQRSRIIRRLTELSSENHNFRRLIVAVGGVEIVRNESNIEDKQESVENVNHSIVAKLKLAGFSAKELKQAGYILTELKNHFEPHVLQQAGFTFKEFKQAECSIIGTTFSAQELYDGGVTFNCRDNTVKFNGVEVRYDINIIRKLNDLVLKKQMETQDWQEQINKQQSDHTCLGSPKKQSTNIGGGIHENNNVSFGNNILKSVKSNVGNLFNQLEDFSNQFIDYLHKETKNATGSLN